MVDPLIGAAAVSGGASLLGNLFGGFMSSSGQAAANQQNMMLAMENLSRQNDFFQQQKDMAYHFKDREEVFGREMFDKAAALQKEFAQHGIRWRSEDAAAAGVHPLFALTGGGASFTPPPIGISGGNVPGAPSGATADMRSSDMGKFMSQAGQDISRAILSTMDRENRAMTAISLERGMLQNDLLRIQIQNARRGVGPAQPSGVGSQSGMTANVPAQLGVATVKPYELAAAQPDSPAVAAGHAQPYVEFRDVGNGLRPMPPAGMKTEDEFGAPLNAQWMADVYANPSQFRPTQAQIEAKWGKGQSPYGIVWDAAQFQWRRGNLNDLNLPARPANVIPGRPGMSVPSEMR